LLYIKRLFLSRYCSRVRALVGRNAVPLLSTLGILTELEWNFCLVCATDLVCFGVPAPYSHLLRQPNSYKRQTFHCRGVEFPENSVVYLALARLKFR